MRKAAELRVRHFNIELAWLGLKQIGHQRHSRREQDEEKEGAGFNRASPFGIEGRGNPHLDDQQHEEDVPQGDRDVGATERPALNQGRDIANENAHRPAR